MAPDQREPGRGPETHGRLLLLELLSCAEVALSQQASGQGSVAVGRRGHLRRVVAAAPPSGCSCGRREVPRGEAAVDCSLHEHHQQRFLFIHLNSYSTMSEIMLCRRNILNLRVRFGIDVY